MKKLNYNSKRTFIWKTSKNQLMLAMLFVLFCFFIFIYCFVGYNMTFEKQWGGWLEAAATIGIVGISISIWYNEKCENWIDSLPKKLNIVYKLKNKDGNYIDFCFIKNAPLAHEGDIRNWGQSIGQTILNQRVSIDFAGFYIDKPVLIKDKKIREFSLTVFLHKEIEKINQGDVFEFDDNGYLLTKSAT